MYWRDCPSALEVSTRKEVGEDSSHALFRIYRLLSDIVSRLKTLRRQWPEQLDNLELLVSSLLLWDVQV